MIRYISYIFIAEMGLKSSYLGSAGNRLTVKQPVIMRDFNSSSEFSRFLAYIMGMLLQLNSCPSPSRLIQHNMYVGDAC